MSGLGLALAVVVSIVLGTLGILALVFLLLRRLRGPAATEGAARVARRYPGVTVRAMDPMAHFLGLESEGVWQVRGTGVLALTDEALWFSMYFVGREIEVPRSAIRGVELVDSHLRKRVFGSKLLQVRYLREGAEERVAWRVGDPAAWQAALR